MSTRFVAFALTCLVVFAVPTSADPPRLQINSKSLVSCLAFSPSGDLLAIGCKDGFVQFVEAATGKEIHSIGTGAELLAMAFSQDGKTVAISQRDLTMSTWLVNTGAKQAAGGIKNYNAEHIAFAPNGQAVVGVSRGKFVQWILPAGGSGSSSPIVGDGYAAMAPDGIVSGWGDSKGLMRIREFDPQRFTTKTVKVGDATCVAFGPNAKLLAVGRGNNEIEVYADITATTLMATIRDLGQPPARLLISADGNTLAVLGKDGTSMRVWDVARRATRRQANQFQGPVGSWAIAPDGKTLATTGQDGKTVLLWNVGTRVITHKGPPLKIPDKELTTLWADLAATDFLKADAAWHKLAAAGDNAVGFLREQIRPIAVPAVDTKRLEKLVADLDSAKFADRDRATKELLAQGELAIVPLERMLTGQPSAEATTRAKSLLKKISQPELTPDRLRVLQAIELLGEVRTEKSIELLKEIQRDTLISQYRREADQALQRITRESGFLKAMNKET